MNHIEGRELIGQAAWNKLVAHAGGLCVDIPSRIETGTGRRMAAWIGEAAASKLIELAAGDRIYIASGWEQTLCIRYAEIIAMHDQGMTPAKIAMAFTYQARYTERNIRMILAGRFDVLRESLGGQYEIPGI